MVVVSDNEITEHFADVMSSWLFLTGKLEKKNYVKLFLNKNIFQNSEDNNNSYSKNNISFNNQNNFNPYQQNQNLYQYRNYANNIEQTGSVYRNNFSINSNLSKNEGIVRKYFFNLIFQLVDCLK